MNTKLTTSLMALALAAPFAYAQDEPATQEVQVQAAEQQTVDPRLTAPLQQDPLVRTGVLENGLHYIIRPTKEPAGRASIRLYINTGSLNETPETSGISHFIEHMVFNGSRTFKRGELIPTMQKLGLGFGGDANAYTGFLQTVYKIDMPNLSEETVNFAFTIIRDFADGATLEDDAIDHERGIVISELHSRDSESLRASLQMMRTLTPGSRLVDYLPIGQESVIQNAPYELVREYYHNHYVPSNMTLIVTGDITYEQGEEWAHKYFDSMEARDPEPRQPMEALTNLGPEEQIIPVNEAGTTNITIAVVSPYEETADTLEQRVADLPMQLACVMLNVRLQRLSREPGCPFMSAGVTNADFMKTSHIFEISIEAAPENWAAAVALADAQVRSAMEYGFTEQEFSEVFTILLTSMQQKSVTWESVTAANMADLIVETLDENEVLTAPDEDFRALEAGAHYIAQDPDVCRRALASAYQGGNTKILVMGVVPEGLDNATLRSTFQQAQAVPAPKFESKDTQAFAYDEIGDPGHVTAREHLADIDTTTLTLSNGIRVNLKPTQSKKNTIHVNVMVDGGLFNMPEVPGLPSIVNAMMKAGGLEAHTAVELQSILAGKHVSVGFGITCDRFTFSGSTTREDAELQCKLIIANILHPGYRPDGEMLLRRALPAQYKERETTRDGVFGTGISKLMYGDDVRFVKPTMEQMEQVHTEDARNAIDPFLKEGAMEITIVGDFDLEEMIGIVERTFGAMPQRKPEFTPVTEEQRAVQLSEWGQTLFLTYPSEVDNTIVAQIWPAGDGRDVKRNRRMRVLADIVSEKLFDGLRADLGQAYSPMVQFVGNEDYTGCGCILMLSEGVKGNREIVDSAMNAICAILGEEGITQEEFDCSIRPLISQLDKQMRANSFWVGALGSIQSKPETLEDLRSLKADMASITYEEINTLAKETFGQNKAHHVFVLPSESKEGGQTETPAGESAETPQAAPEEGAAPEVDAGQAAKESPAAQEPVSYVVVISERTAAMPEWQAVADALVAKYNKQGWKATCVVLPNLRKATISAALREHGARYVAYVMRPEEVGRKTVNQLHRAARMVDDDPWGDCIWGIVTGFTADDAMRIATTEEPLVIKRLLGSTNIGWEHFEYSYCITDWTNFPVLEQSGYTEPTTTTYTTETPEGCAILQEGTQGLFAEKLETAKPQIIVTSSHATQFNLEMPFSMGLILPSNNRFYQLPRHMFRDFMPVLSQATRGNTTPLEQFPAQKQLKEIKPDGTTRVWLAPGNCLIGDACNSKHSMAVTAISAYTCNQFVGYTVPSWFGAGGWGTLSCFFDGADGTPLSEAWFINNQFILADTMAISPKLMEAEFNGEQVNRQLYTAVDRTGVRPANQQEAQKCIGLVHDRDVVVLYGDPAWSASLDCSHSHCPYTITWNGPKQFTITANGDRKGRLGVWFPTAETGKDATGCDAEGAIFTNDFVLFPELDMKKGESKTVNIK